MYVWVRYASENKDAIIARLSRVRVGEMFFLICHYVLNVVIPCTCG